MANLKEVRGRIKSVKTTQQMTRAMKMVAAAKLRKAQDNILRLRPYALKLKEIMGDLSDNVSDGLESPYARVRPVGKVLIVIITSNRGLCGAFNANIIKHALKVIDEQYQKLYKEGNVHVLCIGKKGYEYFKRQGYNMVGANHDVYTNLSFEKVNEVAARVMTEFVEGTYDKVEIVYNEFKNVLVQNRVDEDFLPVAPDIKGDDHQEDGGMNADYIFEPNQQEILSDLIPKSLKVQFYKAILESNAAEQGARMTAMDNATNNADELLKELKLTYNRARQAAITTEILEIVGGAEALSNG